MFYFTLYHQHKRKDFVFKRPSLLPLPLFSKGSQYYKDYYLAWACLSLGIKYLLLGGQTFKLRNFSHSKPEVSMHKGTRHELYGQITLGDICSASK